VSFISYLNVLAAGVLLIDGVGEILGVPGVEEDVLDLALVVGEGGEIRPVS
jgi:hypothetical protein